MITASQAAEKHNRNLKNAETDIRNGINALTVSPTVQAAKKQDKMLANLTAAIRDGSWKRGLEAVTLEDWRKSAIEIGIPRIAAGIDAARADVEKFFADFLPFLQGVQNQIEAMPDLSFQDSLARMIANAKAIKEYKRK